MELSTTQKGKISEMLVAIVTMLQSEGHLRVSLPFTDDEGIDLFVTDKETNKSARLQVKSLAKLGSKGRFKVNVPGYSRNLVGEMAMFTREQHPVLIAKMESDDA